MTNLLTYIENDDIENFTLLFDINHWKDSITTIANYADLNAYKNEVSYNDCDCFKYSVHCNAEKIFNYLLPLVDTYKHGDNYGWPLLSMAVKNGNYDFANKIVQHPSFNPYAMYHTNVFFYIENYKNIPEHIEFLFNYLPKFNLYDFNDQHVIYTITQLIFYNEDTFHRMNEHYKKLKNDITNMNDFSILDIYENHYNLVAEELFKRRFNPVMLAKLTPEYLKKTIASVMDQVTVFHFLFESSNAQQGLSYLLKYPQLMQQHFDKNPVIVSYLPLDCILELIEHNIDIWKTTSNNYCALDYILDNSDLEDEKTLYFLNHYTEKIYHRASKQGRDNLKNYCHQKLLNENFPRKNTKNHAIKI